MDKVTFETNIPRELRLRYAEGKLVESKNPDWGAQYMFSTDKGPFYVAEMVGNILHDQIRKQGVQPGDWVEICRREVDQGRGRKSLAWELKKVGCAPGHQPDGTYAVPKPPPTNGHAAGAGVPPPAPQAAAPEQPSNINGNGSRPMENGNEYPTNGNGLNQTALWAARVKAATQARLELYYDLCGWAAERFGGTINASEVQAFLMNTLISADKNGGAR
jgi:hypothetical protein